MKTRSVLFSFILILSVMSFGVIAAQSSTIQEKFSVDTLVDAETITFAPTTKFTQAGDYGLYIVADSLTGSTDAIAYLDVAAYGTDDWVPIQSFTIDGVQTVITKESKLYANKIRLRVVGSGTQTTKLSGFLTWFRER